MGVDILVCNLTRLGDLLQSQPLIDALASSGHKVGLLCLENFQTAASLLRNVEKVWVLPGSRVLAQTQSVWPAAAGLILNFIDDITKDGAPGYVINLTPSLPARLLTRLLALRGSQIAGFGLDSLGYGVNHGVWASFLSVAARKRMNAPFNVADMMRKMGQSLSGNKTGSCRLKPPPAADLTWAERFLGQAFGASPVKGFVGLQLGASETRRQWPVEFFAELGDHLQEKGYMPVLLGGPAEKELAARYISRAAHPCLNTIGQTTLPQLAALLARMRLLVTNDTGTMHLAAGQGVPSLAFFLATAQPWDTGPLLPGCCCLEPALPCHPCAFGKSCKSREACRQTISPLSAASLVLAWLEHGDWSRGITSGVEKECRVWLTRTDEEGFTNVEPLTSHGSETRSLWLAALRDFWRQLLDSLDLPGAGSPDFSRLSAPTTIAREAAPALEQGAQTLQAIIDCGQLARKNPQAGQLFLRNCERLQALLDTCQPLGTMAAFWREFRQTQGGNLDQFLPAAQVLQRALASFGARLERI